MRVIVPVTVGAVFGALVVSILLSDRTSDDPSPAVTNPAERAGGSTGTALATASGNATVDALAASEAGGLDTSTQLTLAEIASITDPAARRAAALALLDVHGHDGAGIDIVAASLPPTEAVNFRIQAIVSLGTSDMPAAFAAAMALPDSEQRRLTLLRLAPVLAGIDPVAALAAIEEIDSPELASIFVSALLDRWTALDPDRVFSYLESADPSLVAASEGLLDALAASDPERLLAMAPDLRRDIATLATTAALETLIERNPESALARIGALPPGSDRSRLQTTAAEAYGQRNPEAAWEWAASAGVDGLARVGVVRGIQKVDPDLAWDIMRSQLNNADDQARAGTREYLMNYVNAVVNSASPDDIVIGLDRLLSLNDPFVDSQMQTNIQAWANRDPEAALDWSLTNFDRIDSPNLLTSLSAGLARTNVELARQTVYRLDEAQRTSWAAGVGRTLAEYDLAAARSWAYEFPTGPLRDAGLREVISGEAEGGTVDRQLFDQFSDERARGEAASSAARRFACDGRTELALETARAYITDEQLLDSTVRQIEGNMPSGVSALSPFTCQMIR